MYKKNGREKWIDIFYDTKKQYEENSKLAESVKKSVQKQKLWLEGENFEEPKESRYETPARVVVSKKRSFEAAFEYPNQKVCVHNFASASNPGGGVTRGSQAQEECLCRCSTLYPCLNHYGMQENFYRRHKYLLKSNQMDSRYNDDCIYTPDVVVFKSDTEIPKLLQENEWMTTDVITCAAPNLRVRPSNDMNPHSGNKQLKMEDVELKELHRKRARRILSLAKKNGVEVIILGAFGCGAFSNPASVVADGWADAVEEFQYDFKIIEFAVYCTPRDKLNYEIFARRLQN